MKQTTERGEEEKKRTLESFIVIITVFYSVYNVYSRFEFQFRYLIF